MATSDVIPLVTDLKPRFFRGLTAPELQEVVAGADYRSFRTDSVILNQGHRAQAVVLLVRGQVRTTYTTNGGKRLLLRWLAAGEVFGLAALLPTSYDYLLSTEAVKESWGLVWGRTTIRNLAQRYPTIWENAFTIVSEALAGYLAVHVSQTRHTAKQRLARTLVDLASTIGNRTSTGVEVGVRNEDLANAANVTEFTASRVVNQWQRNGLVIKTRGRIVIRSLEGLLLHDV